MLCNPVRVVGKYALRGCISLFLAVKTQAWMLRSDAKWVALGKLVVDVEDRARRNQHLRERIKGCALYCLLPQLLVWPSAACLTSVRRLDPL
jgi:hypothetical protein